MLPTKRVMDHDRLEDALFASSGDEVERFDRTISVWRIVLVVDQLLDMIRPEFPGHLKAMENARFGSFHE